jgi:hypothetical protein
MRYLGCTDVSHDEIAKLEDGMDHFLLVRLDAPLLVPDIGQRTDLVLDHERPLG